jgi:hypothetical protein
VTEHPFSRALGDILAARRVARTARSRGFVALFAAIYVAAA